MKKLILAIAGAMAIGFAAHAANESWFDGGIATGWPETATGGAWANTTDQAALEDGKLVVEVPDATNALQFAATEAKTIAANTKTLKCSAYLEFNPFSSVDAIPTNIIAEAKVGVAVVSNADENAYYVIAKDADGETNAWSKVDTLVPVVDAQVPVVFEVTDATNVVYTLNGTALDAKAIAAGDATFSKVAFTGDGSVSNLVGEIDADVTLKLPSYGENVQSVVVTTNGSATAIDPVSGVYNLRAGSVVTVTLTAKDGYLFADGSNTKVYGPLAIGKDVDLSAEEPETPTEAEAKIGTTYYLTLKEAVDAAETSDLVELAKNVTLAETLNITKQTAINLAGHTITLGASLATGIYAYEATKLTVTNGAIAVENGRGNITGSMAIYMLRTSGEFKDLSIEATGFEYVLTQMANIGDLGLDKDKYWTDASPYTLACDAVSVEGNGSLFHIEYATATLDNCSATHTLAAAFGTSHQAAIYSSCGAKVTVNGGTFQSTNALQTGSFGGEITINGATLTGDIKSYMTPNKATYAHNAAKIAITSGTVNGNITYATEYDPGCTKECTLLTWDITGGTFSFDPSDYITDPEIKAVKQGEVWVVAAPTAKIGTTYFLTLNEAFEAVKDGEAIVLMKNLAITARYDVSVSGKTVTLDMNGKKVTRTADSPLSGNGSAFNIVAGTLTISGGEIDCSSITQDGTETPPQTGECDAITVRAGATLYLANMTIQVNSRTGACVYPFAGGNVYIQSGTYKNLTTLDYPFQAGYKALVVNQFNATPQSLQISGGTFYGQDPATGDDSGAVTSFLAPGYYSVTKSEGVNEITNEGLAAAIGNKGFTTLVAALEAADTDETVTLLANNTEENLTVPAAVTLDLASYTIVTNGLVNSGKIKVYQTQIAKLEEYANVVGTLVAGSDIADAGTPAAATMYYPQGTELTLTTETVTEYAPHINIRPTLTVDVPNAKTILWKNGVASYKKMVVNGDAQFGGAICNGWSADKLPTELEVAGNLTLASNVTITNFGSIKVTSGTLTAGDYTITLQSATAKVIYADDGALKTAGKVVTSISGAEVSYSDGVYSLGSPAAKIGTTYFLTLNQAFEAVKDGETIVLQKDLAITARYDVSVSGKTVTLDMNGKKVTRTADSPLSGNGSAFNIVAGTLTISGGEIDCSSITQDGTETPQQTGECDAITVRAGATLYLANMTIQVNSRTGACVYPFAGGNVYIQSGTYKNLTTLDYPFQAGYKALVVNQFNATPQSLQISGGTFYGQDPATGDDSGAVTSFLAPGYYSVTKSEGVNEITNEGLAAAIGNKGFTTVEAAVEALTDDDTLKLLADATLTQAVAINADATIDLGGYTLNGDSKIGSKVGCITFAAGKTVTVSNGTINAGQPEGYGPSVKGTLFFDATLVVGKGSTPAAAFDVFDGANLTLGANANAQSVGSQLIRCKDEFDTGATATVMVKGGTYSCSASSPLFSVYKANGTLNLTVEGGTFAGGYVFCSGHSSDNPTCTLNANITGGEFTASKNTAQLFPNATITPKFTKTNCGGKFALNDETAANCASLRELCADGYKPVQSGDWYVIDEITYATLTITKGENVNDFVVTNGVGETVTNGQKFDVDDKVEVQVGDLTFAEGYEFDAANSVTNVTMDANRTINVQAKKILYTVTFSTNETEIAGTSVQVAYNEQLAANQIPEIAVAGHWDVNPTNATIVCATNFNFTVESEVPVTPGETKSYDTEDAAKEAADKAVVPVPDGLPEGYGSTYQNYFEPTTPVENPTTGKWEFEMVLKDEVKTEVTNEITTATVSINLETVAAGEEQTINVTTKPGLWYNFVQGSDVKAMTGTPFMATKTSEEFKPTNKGAKGFYTIKAGATQAEVE